MTRNPPLSAAIYQQVLAKRENIIEQMQRHYPSHRLRDIHAVAYRATRTRPEDIIQAGGFIPVIPKVHVSTAMDAPNNEGLVDFSFVPEVTAIFKIHKKPAERYMYAAPVDKGYLMPGQWRQVAVPALPLPEFMAARKIISHDYKQLTLGEPVIFGKVPEHFLQEETLQHFLHTPTLDIPQDIGLGDENYTPHYTIKDTPTSRRFFPTR